MDDDSNTPPNIMDLWPEDPDATFCNRAVNSCKNTSSQQDDSYEELKSELRQCKDDFTSLRAAASEPFDKGDLSDPCPEQQASQGQINSSIDLKGFIFSMFGNSTSISDSIMGLTGHQHSLLNRICLANFSIPLISVLAVGGFFALLAVTLAVVLIIQCFTQGCVNTYWFTCKSKQELESKYSVYAETRGDQYAVLRDVEAKKIHRKMAATVEKDNKKEEAQAKRRQRSASTDTTRKSTEFLSGTKKFRSRVSLFNSPTAEATDSTSFEFKTSPAKPEAAAVDMTNRNLPKTPKNDSGKPKQQIFIINPRYQEEQHHSPDEQHTDALEMTHTTQRKDSGAATKNLRSSSIEWPERTETTATVHHHPTYDEPPTEAGITITDAPCRSEETGARPKERQKRKYQLPANSVKFYISSSSGSTAEADQEVYAITGGENEYEMIKQPTVKIQGTPYPPRGARRVKARKKESENTKTGRGDRRRSFKYPSPPPLPKSSPPPLAAETKKMEGRKFPPYPGGSYFTDQKK